jgi:hypothetical protein
MSGERCDCPRAQRRSRQSRCSFNVGHYRCDEALRASLQGHVTQLGCSSLMFAIAYLCPKRDRSVRCAAAGDCAVVIIIFLSITTDDRIGITWSHSFRGRQLVKSLQTAPRSVTDLVCWVSELSPLTYPTSMECS